MAMGPKDNIAFGAAIDVCHAIMTAISDRDVSADFGLQHFEIRKLRVYFRRYLLYHRVDVSFTVRERTTLEETELESHQDFWPARFWREPTKLQKAKMIRKALIGAFWHELNEHITIDGARPFDPHRKLQPPPPLPPEPLNESQKQDLE